MAPLDEARAHMEAGEKALKTSWVGLKFTPDHLTASLEFSQAATKFRSANQLDDAIKAWVRSAELKEQLRDTFGAGRAYESAGAICDSRGPGGAAEAMAHWRKAISCFRLSGKAEIAGKLILKVAEASEKQGDMDSAKDAYDQAVEVFRDDEKDYNLGDVYKQMISFLVRAGRMEDAQRAIDQHVDLLNKQKHQSFAYKEILAKVVLYLNARDPVRAEQALTPQFDIEGWFMSKESQVGTELLTAFQENDPEGLDRVLKEQVFTFLNVEVARIAKKLRLPTLSGVPAAAGAGARATAASAAGSAAAAVGAGGAPAAGAQPTPEDMAELLM